MQRGSVGRVKDQIPLSLALATALNSLDFKVAPIAMYAIRVIWEDLPVKKESRTIKLR